VDRLRILINEDVPSDAELLEYEIRKAGFDFVSTRVETREGFLAALREFAPDAIVSDYSLPSFTGMQALMLAREHAPFTPFIVATGALNEEIAVDCMKAGADDYVLKDRPVRIGPALRAAMEKKSALLEKQRTEERLAGSERRFRAIFENANDAIFLLDDDLFVECNPMAERMFAASRDELLYRSPLEFSPVEQPNGGNSRELIAERNRATLGGAPQSFEWRHQQLDGTPFDVDVVLSPVVIEGKSLILSIVRDITERKLMEKDLREGEEKFRRMSQEFNALLDAIPDSLLLQSRDLEIVWANRTAISYIGENDPGSDERHCYRLLHRTSSPHAGCPVLEVFRTGLPAKNIITLPDDRTWEVRAVPVKDENDEVENVIELGRDVTEIKKLEQQLVHAQKMEAVGQLAGGIAHDFNNIVTALIGYGNLLLMKLAEEDPSRHFVEQILSTAERAADLTQGLLAFSRKKVFNLQPVDFNDVIRVFQSFLVRIIGDDVEVRTDLEPRELIVMADSGQMEQVLMNLAANARDAMPDGGTLTITAARCELDASYIKAQGYGEPGVYLQVEISDTGVGMDEETQRKIFEPFYTTKESGKGTGLGLSIAYGIVKEHRGYINVRSRPGIGSTFRIFLPLIEEKLHKLEISRFTMPEGGDETIILAEDDGTVLAMEAKLLQTYGYRVITAADGGEAMERFMAARDEVRLLILDIMMPSKGGIEVAAAARQLRPDIRVLFNSGYPLDLLQKKGMLQGDVPFFTKPIAPRELLRKVRELLDGAPSSDAMAADHNPRRA
jgi:PAS domain S-box-containing protein